MSLQSMTGYGRADGSNRSFRFEVELSSVNRKQLDLHLQAPHLLQPLLPRIRERLQKRLSRGRVNVSIQYTALSEKSASQVHVDRPLAASYLAALREAGEELGLAASAEEELLLKLPQVVKVREPRLSEAALWTALKPVLEEGLERLLSMRGTEGERLAKVLSGYLKQLEKLRKSIAKRAPLVAKEHRLVLQARLEKAGLSSIDWDDERMARELLLFSDRSDIAEELQRLSSHLVEAKRLLGVDEPVGRTLDFLCQELFREINTTGSKASDTHIALDVVQFKTILEQFREQIQNVE